MQTRASSGVAGQEGSRRSHRSLQNRKSPSLPRGLGSRRTPLGQVGQFSGPASPLHPVSEKALKEPQDCSRIIDSICADTSPAIRQGEWEGGPTRSQADVHPRVWTSASGRRAVKLIGWSPNPSKSKRDRYSCRRKPNGLIRFYWSYWLSQRESMTIRSTAFLSF